VGESGLKVKSSQFIGEVKNSQFSIHRKTGAPPFPSVLSPCLCVSVVNKEKQSGAVKNSKFAVHRKTGAPPFPFVHSPCLCVSVLNEGKAGKSES
jgi:hypothetical protein